MADLVARTAQVKVDVAPGFPPSIDAVTGGHAFLRAAWLGDSGDGARTILAAAPDGRPLLALPIRPAGPSMLGVAGVPGGYWPFRSPVVAIGVGEAELAAALAHPDARAALGPCWRVGPAYVDDPGVSALRAAARRAGWTVLARPLGRAWELALDGRGWPGPSSRKRLDQYQRRLGASGPVRFDTITGPGWSDEAIDALARIEAASWVGTRTSGRGAKFLTDGKRAHWRRVLADPVLARALSATILRVGDAPVAFSFDLTDGSRQYAIASGYDERFAACRPGRLVTRHQLDRAAVAGVAVVDLGAGDSGYKREMGARPGPRIADLLFVRRRPLAALLSLHWGPADDDVGPTLWREPLLAGGVLAAATAFATLAD